MIYVAELILPGTRILLDDKDAAHIIKILIGLLRSELAGVAISLNAYVQSVQCLMGPPEPRDVERDQQDYNDLIEKLSAVGDDGSKAIGILEVHKRNLKIRDWDAGITPQEYKQEAPHIFAKSFVNSMDMIMKLLKKLQKQVQSRIVDSQVSTYETAFPDLKDVRDSAAHLEDRGLGKDINDNDIELKPISNNMFQVSGGFLILSNLNNDRLEFTKNDGELGGVNISPESLYLARDCIQEVISNFKWEGHASSCPA